jgi:hypothetical protein
MTMTVHHPTLPSAAMGWLFFLWRVLMSRV